MSGQDALLATKLHVPRPQPGFVPRPRLVQALSQGLARGRVLICAPAGFGKTSLLADWACSGGRPVAWEPRIYARTVFCRLVVVWCPIASPWGSVDSKPIRAIISAGCSPVRRNGTWS